MRWIVEFIDQFEEEFYRLNEKVQDELLAHAKLLAQFGPTLGRPHVDTLKGSRHDNMKELRFIADKGVWRAAFAFDPKRRAVILLAGNKAGKNERRFYRNFIAQADKRYDTHLKQLKNNGM